MFEQSLVESTHAIKSQNRWSVWASLAIQAAVAAAIVVIPLMHPATLGRLTYHAPELFAPVPPAPPPPPPLRVHVVAAMSEAAMPMAAIALSQPVASRFHSAVDAILRSAPEGDGPPGLATNMSMGSPTGTGTGTNPFGTAPTGANVAVARPSKVTLSTGVTAGMLMAPIRPVYPVIAKTAHQEGTVVVHAIISRKGLIESATVVSGPALLRGAALDAVEVARYRPFLLNGEPTEVDTTINIVFHLND